MRYFGPIEATKGDWLGVEWDEPGRGKHDGSHKGVKYFECRYETKYKSFFIGNLMSENVQSFLLEIAVYHLVICMNSFVIRVRS